MLVALHALIDVMCYDAPSVHSDAYYIPELLLVGCLAPVCLRLASCQDIGVEFAAQLIQGVNLHSVCKNPQAIKIFHYNANAVIWFGTRSLAICCLVPKVIYLPSNLVPCSRLMLSNLECGFSELGILRSHQVGSILFLYTSDQFICRWASSPSKILSTGIKLF
jgi:hypothetical protein